MSCSEMSGLTDGVGRQALRIASELVCSGVYLGSCRMGCILKGCLLFIDIMVAEVWEGPSSSLSSVFGDVLKKKRLGEKYKKPATSVSQMQSGSLINPETEKER